MVTTPVITAAAVLAGGAGMAALGLAPPRFGALLTVVFGLATTAVVGVLALVVLTLGGLRAFGVVHLAYLGLVVSVPLIGAASAARAVADPGARLSFATAGVVLLLPAVVGWYATHVEPYRLSLDRATVAVPAERAGDDPVRIGVLADLQTNQVGDHERRAVDRLLAEDPDLILVPGDLFQGSEQRFAEQEDELRGLLGKLQPPYGVYAVRGDVDHGDFADRALRGTGAVILDDEIVDVRVGDRRLRIAGNRLAYAHPDAVAVRRELEAVPEGEDDGAIRILVAHRPDAALGLVPGSRVDLTVAGHTHGGQVVIPGLGPPLTLTRVPRTVAAGGLHELNGNPIYVSTGVGLERLQAPQVRLFSRPSVGIIELR